MPARGLSPGVPSKVRLSAGRRWPGRRVDHARGTGCPGHRGLVRDRPRRQAGRAGRRLPAGPRPASAESPGMTLLIPADPCYRQDDARQRPCGDDACSREHHLEAPLRCSRLDSRSSSSLFPMIEPSDQPYAAVRSRPLSRTRAPPSWSIPRRSDPCSARQSIGRARPARISPVVVTLANSSCRLAAVARVSSSADSVPPSG